VRAPAASHPPRDEGSAIVDFALVGSVLTVLSAAVVQLGIALYVHNTLVSCAAEGARYGARADHDVLGAQSATRELVAESLSASYAGDVSVDEEWDDGVRTVVVHIRAPLPILGLFGAGRAMQATGHAYAERQ
jgi:Flp pilus assembly protein TadG